jgi:hypothetical protein
VQILFVAALGALLLLSIGLNIFLFQQMRVARGQVASSRGVVQSIDSQYRVKEPAMRQFVDALQAFALTNPDFQPVLQRYRVALPQFFPRPTLIVSNQIPVRR